jgi:hypothetical protein
MPLTPKKVLKQFRYAMYFDGLKSYVDLGAPSVIKNFSQSSFTVIAWFLSLGYYKPDGSLSYGRIVTDDNYPYSPGVYGMWSLSHGDCGLTDTQACIRFYFRGDPPTNFDYTWIYYRTWYMLAVARDLNVKQNRGYVNGSLVATQSIVGYIFSPNTYPVSIGGETDTSYERTSKVYGLIAKVIFYSRALSDSEILWNYQYPDNPVRSGLVLWLQADPNYVKDVDGDGVLEWIDLSGYNNHGKIYGASLVQLIKTPSRVLSPVRVLTPVR